MFMLLYFRKNETVLHANVKPFMLLKTKQKVIEFQRLRLVSAMFYTKS